MLIFIFDQEIPEFVPVFKPNLPPKLVINEVEVTDNDSVEDMHRQLEDLHFNQIKIAKAIKKISSKPKSTCQKTKSKSKTKKKEIIKHVNAHIILDELSSDSSDSKNDNTTFSKNEIETNTWH
ncbi:hypothetical protein F8M41_019796 [Gigaspora margarita]|uniref:Uncharacterized protein n=1 Tax=Gigaspora margarita TaxID=4874 RepID=A0A8H4EKD9_GIGMA|nr:hypothetical protein F8M41_019796 [Gigaspora margarita]